MNLISPNLIHIHHLFFSHGKNPMFNGKFHHMFPLIADSHRIHGAAIYGNMDPINIPLYVSIYSSNMDPMDQNQYLYIPFLVGYSHP